MKANYTMEGLAQKAVSLAMSGDWKEAVKINLQILDTDPASTDALNRLARSYAELGLIAKAKATAKKVLKIDSVNPIASKAIQKWRSVKKMDSHTSPSTTSLPESFLEEPGKTKIVPLIHVGDKEVLASLDSGDAVTFLTHPHRISVVTKEGKYIGRLPDDLAARLNKLIKLGDHFQVLIKSTEDKEVKIFIRGEAATFPPEKIDYVSFTPPELVHKETPVNILEEEV